MANKKAQEAQISAEDIERFRAMLQQKRWELAQNLAHLGSDPTDEARLGSGTESNLPTHPADRGTDEYERDLSASLLARERAQLIEVDDALRRIEDGTYGLCQATGEPIGKERLRAKPWARFCIEYEREAERSGSPPPSPEQTGR